MYYFTIVSKHKYSINIFSFNMIHIHFLSSFNCKKNSKYDFQLMVYHCKLDQRFRVKKYKFQAIKNNQ